MAKVSINEAIRDLMNMVFGEFLKENSSKRYSYEEILEIFYKSMYKLSLDYLDRCDDVATREMSLEIDRLNELNESILEENRRLQRVKP
jgi:hypothetical protein